MHISHIFNAAVVGCVGLQAHAEAPTLEEFLPEMPLIDPGQALISATVNMQEAGAGLLQQLDSTAETRLDMDHAIALLQAAIEASAEPTQKPSEQEEQRREEEKEQEGEGEPSEEPSDGKPGDGEQGAEQKPSQAGASSSQHEGGGEVQEGELRHMGDTSHLFMAQLQQRFRAQMSESRGAPMDALYTHEIRAFYAALANNTSESE